MYLRAQTPQKIVELVKSMLRQRYFVSSRLMLSWAEKLKAGDHEAEEEEVLVAESQMCLLWQESVRMKSNEARRDAKKTERKQGSEEAAERKGSKETFEKRVGKGPEGADARAGER